MTWPGIGIDAIVHPVAGLVVDLVPIRCAALPCFAAMLALSGCQSRGPEYPDMDTPIVPPVHTAETPPVRVAPVPQVPGTLYRDEVLAVVDGGLGLFLQHVEVDAHLEDGRFRGFRILRLAPPDYWRGVDLRPGDVVERVNGMAIERPLEAHEAFSSLRTAERLVVSYVRAGERRELVYQIRSRPSVKAPAPERQSPMAPPPVQSES